MTQKKQTDDQTSPYSTINAQRENVVLFLWIAYQKYVRPWLVPL